ncbi:MAG: hypothetical protein ABFD76_06745 [Smithella sp.]
MANYKKVTPIGRNRTIIEIELIEKCILKDDRLIWIPDPKERNPKKGTSSEKQQARNNAKAMRNLSRKINENLEPGDLFLTGTYRGKIQPTEEQAEKDIKELIRHVRQIGKWMGARALKAIAVIEDEDKRIHIHALFTATLGADEIIIRSLWKKHGKMIISTLDPTGEYTGIANYISKETPRPHKKRWIQTRNLRMPKSEYEEITKEQLSEEIEAIPGYRKLYETYTFIDGADGIGRRYRYAKFIKNGNYDLAWGETETVPEDIDND